MSKGPYPFKESDITRAFKAAEKAGVKVQIEIDVGRKTMRVIPVGEACSSAATADDELAQWRKRRGHAHSG